MFEQSTVQKRNASEIEELRNSQGAQQRQQTVMASDLSVLTKYTSSIAAAVGRIEGLFKGGAPSTTPLASPRLPLDGNPSRIKGGRKPSDLQQPLERSDLLRDSDASREE